MMSLLAVTIAITIPIAVALAVSVPLAAASARYPEANVFFRAGREVVGIGCIARIGDAFEDRFGEGDGKRLLVGQAVDPRRRLVTAFGEVRQVLLRLIAFPSAMGRAAVF
jgi:hypothetical protein